MALIVASQFEDAFNDKLRALDLKPEVIPVPENEPWSVADRADILFITPSPIWRSNRPKPEPWPGRLKWVMSGSTGVDWYPSWLLDAPVVTCGRGIASSEIADYVVAAIYLQAKNLEAVRARSLSQWTYASLGSVAGSTVGVLGLGSVGTEVARRALALGANVVATRRGGQPGIVNGVLLVDEPAKVAAVADHLVVAMPLTSATRHLVDALLLARVKPGAHLINVSRGGIVDQEALLAALDTGRLGFATLDVTDPEPLPEGHPLWTHSQVRLTPHISSNSAHYWQRMFEKVANDLSRFARGEVPSDMVDPAAGY